MVEGEQVHSRVGSLAQHFQDVLAKLRQLVEEENATLGEADLAGALLVAFNILR